MDNIIARTPDRLIKSQLIVAHPGATMCEMLCSNVITKLEAESDNDIAVGTQHGVFAQYPGMTPHQRSNEFIPNGITGIKLVVVFGTQAQCTITDPFQFVL